MTQSPQYINNPATRSQRRLALALASQVLTGAGWKVTPALPMQHSSAFLARAPDGQRYLFAYKLRNCTSTRYDDTPIDVVKWNKLEQLCISVEGKTGKSVKPAFLAGYIDGKFRLFLGHPKMYLFTKVTARQGRNDPNDIDPTYNIPHGRSFPIIN